MQQHAEGQHLRGQQALMLIIGQPCQVVSAKKPLGLQALRTLTYAS